MDIYPSWPNLPTMMFARAREWSDRPMLRHYEAGGWHSTSWAQFARKAASLARGLRAAGVSPGDRVLLVSESRPEVPIVETALMAIRAVPVLGYVVNTEADHAHLLRDSGARVAIASSLALARKILAAAEQVNGLDLLLCMEPGPHPLLGPLLDDPAPPDDIAAEAEQIGRGALACLIYTSGTSGLPRGVMLPHRAMLANCEGAFELVRPLKLDHEIYLSFLPLSHSFEHTVGQFFLLSLGTEIVYARGIEHLAADLATIQPTILALVPRILESIRTRILTGLKRETPFKQQIFARTLAAGLRRLDGTATLLDRLANPVFDRLVRRKIRQRLGGRFRVGISGGARLDPEIGRFFLAMGIMVIQGYGQTEAGPVISANPPLRPKIHTVGRPLQGVELR
ncbi:MAG: AMP-dependent synthetase/ligase, partial [Janthinobacterium lividum]